MIRKTAERTKGFLFFESLYSMRSFHTTNKEIVTPCSTTREPSVMVIIVNLARLGDLENILAGMCMRTFLQTLQEEWP